MSATRSLRTVVLMMAALAALLRPAVAHADTRHVLLLYSYEREFAPHGAFAELFRSGLGRVFPDPIDFVEVSLQSARASRTAPDRSIVDQLEAAMAGRRPDLVVTIGGPAAKFAQAYRSRFFPGTPFLLADVDRRFIDQATFTPNDAVVAVEHDPIAMVDSMLALVPDTTTIAVIIGSSQLEQFWLQEVQREFVRFEGKVRFVWTNELSYDRLIKLCSTLPPHSAILFGVLTLDGAGQPQVEARTLSALHASANAPVFGLHSWQLGQGIVGGPLLSVEELGRNSVAVAVQLLNGTVPRSIEVPIQRAGTPVYDARELRRWNIADDRLPGERIVQFGEPAEADQYRNALFVTVLLSGALIVVATTLGLKVVRGQQNRFTLGQPAGLAPSVVGLDPQALSSLSQRLMHVQEQQRASIARTLSEDVCQRMVTLAVQLRAAMSTSVEEEAHGTVREVSDQLSSLAGEILAIPDPLYHRLDLLGFSTTAAGLCRELTGRYGVNVHFRSGSLPHPIPEGVAVALLRVMEETAINAATHSTAKDVFVAVSSQDNELCLEVSDRGVGFDPRTTANGGKVGLVSIRERIRMVEGTCEIRSEPGEGTRVTARVPLPKPPAVDPSPDAAGPR